MGVFRATMSASKKTSPLGKSVLDMISLLEKVKDWSDTNPAFRKEIFNLIAQFKVDLNGIKIKSFAEKIRGNVGGDENAPLTINAETRKRALAFRETVQASLALLAEAGCPIEVASTPSSSKAVGHSNSVNIGTDVEGLVTVDNASTSPKEKSPPAASESKKTRPRVTPPKPEKHSWSSSASSSTSYKSTDARSVYGSGRSDRRKSRDSVERRRPQTLPIPVSPGPDDVHSPTTVEAPPKPEKKSIGVLASPKFQSKYTSTPSTWPVKKTLQNVACGPDAPSTRSLRTQTDPPKPAEKVFRDGNGKIIKPPPGSIVWAAPPKGSPVQESAEVKKHSRNIAALALSQLDGHATSHGIIRAYFLQGTNDIGQQTEATSTADFNSQAGHSVSTRDMGTEMEQPTFNMAHDAESLLRKQFDITFSESESAPSVSPVPESDSSRKRRGNSNAFAESAPKRNRPLAPTTITETDGTDATVDFKPEPSVPIEEEPSTQTEAESEELLPPMEATSSSTISSGSFAMPNTDFLSSLKRLDQRKRNSPPSIAASPMLAENPIVVTAAAETSAFVEPEPVASTSAASEPGPSVPRVKEEVDDDDDVVFIGHKKDKRKKEKERRHSKTRAADENAEKKEEDVAEMVKRLVAETVQAHPQYVIMMPMQTDGMAAGIPMGPPGAIPMSFPPGHPMALPPGAMPMPPMNQYAPGGVPPGMPASSMNQFAPGAMPQGVPTSSVNQYAPGGVPPGIPVSPLQSPNGGFSPGQQQFRAMTPQQFRIIQQQQQQQYPRPPHMLPPFQPNPQQHPTQMLQMPPQGMQQQRPVMQQQHMHMLQQQQVMQQQQFQQQQQQLQQQQHQQQVLLQQQMQSGQREQQLDRQREQNRHLQEQQLNNNSFANSSPVHQQPQQRQRRSRSSNNELPSPQQPPQPRQHPVPPVQHRNPSQLPQPRQNQQQPSPQHGRIPPNGNPGDNRMLIGILNAPAQQPAPPPPNNPEPATDPILNDMRQFVNQQILQHNQQQ